MAVGLREQNRQNYVRVAENFVQLRVPQREQDLALVVAPVLFVLKAGSLDVTEIYVAHYWLGRFKK